MNVKEERQDEAEINELAAKIVAENDAKMALSKKPPPQGGQSMNIISFFTNTRNNASSSPSDSQTKQIDEESSKGNFGWTYLGNMYIPYILRSGESYCAVRILEMKVLDAILNHLHQGLYNFMYVKRYYMTTAEATLLNEINFKHCDYQFGCTEFTSKDLIISLADANELYTFLKHCNAKLMNGRDCDNLDRCGFIRINRESVVPFIMYNQQKHVPIFYFEGETRILQKQAIKVERWDLSYLNFCFTIQGIRKDLFVHESCLVVNLNVIKSYFPPETIFEDFYPKIDLGLIYKHFNPQQQGVQRTQQPVANPSFSHKPTLCPMTANNSRIEYVNVNPREGEIIFNSTLSRTATNAMRPMYPLPRSRAPAHFNINNGQAPPPKVQVNFPLELQNQYTFKMVSKEQKCNFIFDQSKLNNKPMSLPETSAKVASNILTSLSDAPATKSGIRILKKNQKVLGENINKKSNIRTDAGYDSNKGIKKM